MRGTFGAGRWQRGPELVKAGVQILTVRDQIAWSYANLARAHAALSEGRFKYKTTDHMIRTRLFKGLRTGTMNFGTIFDDEKLKHTEDRRCSYCGSNEHLNLDHLIARVSGGQDDGANLVFACRSCNSSKGGQELLQWLEKQGRFPRLMVLRRYIKVIAVYCGRNELLDRSLEHWPDGVPFDVRRLPTKYPPLSDLSL